jgi:F420-non-reducing hydrogenase iron-sulfur subunit
MCSASVSPHHILLAFQKGVDGVFVGGCHIGDCHYLYGNYATSKRIKFLKELLSFSGIEQERIKLKWVSSAEAPEFVEAINEFVKTLKEIGPSPLKEIKNSAQFSG